MSVEVIAIGGYEEVGKNMVFNYRSINFQIILDVLRENMK